MKPLYKIMFFVSMALTLLAIVCVVSFGLHFGIDFKGGSLMEIVFDGSRPNTTELGELISSVPNVKTEGISPEGDKGMIIRLNDIDEVAHQSIVSKITQKFGKITENRFDSIGPTIGKELRSKSIKAIILLLLAISIYIAIVFRRISKILSPWAMGFSAIIALLHDLLVPIGVFAILGHYFGIEVSAVFVAAALTILGYSLSDSVVVFDRVRENILRSGTSLNFPDLVHKSIMQTLVRSLNSTFTAMLSLIAVYFFGGETLKYFSLAMIIGIFCGAYSSIFVASPILIWLNGRRSRK